MKTLIVLFTSIFMLSVAQADHHNEGAVGAMPAKKDCSSDATYGEVTKAQLKSMIKKKSVFVIDVNSKSSFKDPKNRIDSAINYAMNADKLGKVLPKNKSKLIVAYCGGPSCSAWKMAAEKACELGYRNVKHFKGGISGWKKG